MYLYQTTMKVFSAVFIAALCVAASRALPEEAAAAPAETAPVVVPAPQPAAPELPATSPKPQPGPKPSPSGRPKPPQDPTIVEAKELERKLEKALRESRGKLEKLEKVLGERRATTLATVEKVKGELLAKAKVAKKEGKKGLRRALIRNVVTLSQLKIRISKLK